MSVIHCSSEVRDRMNDITVPFHPPPLVWNLEKETVFSFIKLDDKFNRFN